MNISDPLKICKRENLQNHLMIKDLCGSLLGFTLAWTFHYSNVTMNWAKARKWCQDNFSDMVVIQNQQENDYLASMLPQRNSSPYFWIGITKTFVNETWRWIGNNSTWIGPESWAQNEPNNNRSTEFCVEIYTSSGRNYGKWNDEKCSQLKYTTCYKVQCTNTTCERGRCSEIVNNVTCQCEPGFKGEKCQTAVECAPVPDPDEGNLICSNVTANRTCRLSCSFGVFTVASAFITCQTNGLWSGPRPNCASYKHALVAVVGSGLVSIVCCVCVCWIHNRQRRNNAEGRHLNEETNPSSATSG